MRDRGRLLQDAATLRVLDCGKVARLLEDAEREFDTHVYSGGCRKSAAARQNPARDINAALARTGATLNQIRSQALIARRSARLRCVWAVRLCHTETQCRAPS
jgi:hypothetical protein